VFHNSGHVPKGARKLLGWQSHLELESLPTGGWGYDHFPASASYAGTIKAELDKDFLGQTGKFHTMWGEFGGFKRAAALQYECAAMLAWGAKCSIGDQLHPSGEMTFDTYDLIGAAYSQVEEKQAWCENTRILSDIALVSPEARVEAAGASPVSHNNTSLVEEGASRMLLELGYQFAVVDLQTPLDNYKVVILPDEQFLNGEFALKIKKYVENGGKLILSGQSLLNSQNDAAVLDIGLELVGKSEFNPDYLVATDLAPSLPIRGPFVIHGGAWNVLADEQWQVLATRRNPYFNRAWDHFCSHQHTPDAEDSEYLGAACNGQIAYFAHPIFTAYRQLGQPLLRDLVSEALKILLPEPLVETSLPTAGRATLTQQNEKQRAILHLLFTVPQKRGANASIYASGIQAVEVIEDIFPLNNIQCKVRLPQEFRQVTLVPAGQSLEFEQHEGIIIFSVPQLVGHQMVELSYA